MEQSPRTLRAPWLRTVAGLALAGFALLPAAIGCSSGDDSQPDSSSQDLRQSKCTASEIDPLVACSAEPCEGLAGDPLMECIDENCPEDVFDVSETCATCIIGNQSSVEAIAAGCGPTQSTSACAPSELDPIVACSAEPCEGMSGDALGQCMGENCPENVWEISQLCAQCIGANQSGVGDMVSACGEGAEPFVPCTAEEVAPIAACGTEPCDGLAGDPLMECLDQNCAETVWDVTETCASCMIANQSSVEDMTGTCGPAPE